ncbi:MAG TPA: rRNA maturation RNase YbeY, partial [Candidatus Binatus sp.]|nr:rRNA maturation RNase YbeY [Candidatus Binatus sp.]
IEQAGSAPPNPRSVKNRAGLPIGDVVISIDTALEQAREYRILPASRLRRLLVHGFLHLIGYDHERSPADARRMFARERALAARIDQRGVVAPRRKVSSR